jgi:hypothetical protein
MGAWRRCWCAAEKEAASLAHVRTIVLHEKFLSTMTQNSHAKPDPCKVLFLHALLCRFQEEKTKVRWRIQMMPEN